MTATVAPWHEVEVELTAQAAYATPYSDVDVWADFSCGDEVLRRPAFWDGESTWRIRFAPPHEGDWDWVSHASVDDPGLTGHSGIVGCRTGAGASSNPLLSKGFWRMSASGRHLVHADGTPALLVADTAWALPFRATPEQVEVYARDRAAKGFNAVLLMTIQPDMGAVGPRDRTQDGGFDVGFEDLPTGHLRELNPGYFASLDVLLGILGAYGIVPILQPVFHGYGWKGLDVAGRVVPPAEYARYCRYLIARYGARPAVYLVGADGTGEEPQVEAAGREVEAWDAYGQPTGIHYQPHAFNRAHQDAEWLDFQSGQTGHLGEHVPERVMDMWRNTPAKGVMNAEPTYEHTGQRGVGAGWWQGHEAWSNLCAGATMGIGYGAASLWQWRLHAEEPGHGDYFLGPGAGWREALDYEGSTYVGLVGKIMQALPFLDMAPDWTRAIAMRALSAPNGFLLVYREGGEFFSVIDPDLPRHLTVIDPRTGVVVKRMVHEYKAGSIVANPGGEPRVFAFTHEPVLLP